MQLLLLQRHRLPHGLSFEPRKIEARMDYNFHLLVRRQTMESVDEVVVGVTKMAATLEVAFAVAFADVVVVGSSYDADLHHYINYLQKA